MERINAMVDGKDANTDRIKSVRYYFRYKVVWEDGSHHFQNNSLSRFEDSFKEAFTMAHVKGVASVDIYYLDRKIATFY